MYTRPIFFKIYSIFTLVTAVLSFLSSMTSLFAVDMIIEELSKTSSIPSDMQSVVSIAVKVSCIPSAIVALFFSYISFSSMFAFARMIQHEESKNTAPFRKPWFVLPAKFYSKFGTVITYIFFAVSAVDILIMIITYSVTHSAFLAVPVLPIIPILLVNVLVYITYYARYKAFGDLLNLLSKSEPDPLVLNDIKENKPSVLRGFCGFLYIMVFVILAVLVILAIVFAGTISAVIGAGATAVIYVIAFLLYVVCFIELAITGCYFDNLAKMLEHYMIKYKLL